MALEDELKSWIRGLTPSEKRFVSLIGKARAGSGSQVLELFDWLKKAKDDETIPPEAAFNTNLPTLIVRLRELILDSLRLLHKEDDINAVLRTYLDEIAILQKKQHWNAAARLIRKAKKQASETSRYSYVLQCIEAELVQARQLPPDQVDAMMRQLREEEQVVVAKHRALGELQHRHDSILALAQQFPFSRNPEIAELARSLAGAALIGQMFASEAYLENALAVNTLGICDLFLSTPEAAIERYRNLLDRWKTKSEWQTDQSDLLLTICKYYQNACFYSTVNPDLVHSDLMSLTGFSGLPAGKLRAFRETMFHHNFILNLNAGRLDEALAMIPEIETWIKKESADLSESQVLPFLCNFMVTEFLSGHFSEANKYLQRILQLPNRKTRVDIREFALVLQPVIQYELGNTSLNEYLTRSGKRHFSKNETARVFELSVLRNIEQLGASNNRKEQQKILTQFATELKTLNTLQQGSVPLLGLNEISMWVQSRKNDLPLPAVFRDEVKKAHAAADIRVFH